jgi:hypothetical protein
MKKLIFLELNEINFDYVHYYINKGHLPNFKKLINKHGVFTTLSEKKYEEIEPWIQWPTIRTGLEYAEHKIFRLGDASNIVIRQHWEILEEQGYSVAALSPINGVNNTKNATFWIPDPWIETSTSGDGFAHRITRAIKQAVNDNSQEILSLSTILVVLEAVFTKSQLSSWPLYINECIGAFKKQHWSKAVVLDRILSDVFITLWKKHQPDFATLFLNAGAHIQHHYMSSSSAYTGKAKNPVWYVPQGVDPVLSIFAMYDKVIGELAALSSARLIMATGLRQVPYEKITYYWRLKKHADFLRKIGVKFDRVQPRMTRDFLVECSSPEQASIAEKLLNSVQAMDGGKIFEEVDNRGQDLFVTLTFPNDITEDMCIRVGNKVFNYFKSDVVFVAIKNGHHDTLGYFIDTQLTPGDLQNNFPIKEIFKMVLNHYGVREDSAVMQQQKTVNA